ncbi:MAG: hypothetical protein KDG89_08530 [Geminicoccaceae bacterium]|nr:hypothetical protein [Geminicoccaceae bacterium]
MIEGGELVLVEPPGLIRQFLERWLEAAWPDGRLSVFDRIEDVQPRPPWCLAPLFVLLMLDRGSEARGGGGAGRPHGR